MTCACPAGLAGQPCPGGQQQGWGPWGTFLLNFQKGNILFLYVFINSSACAPWRFYTLLPVSALGLHPPVSHFTPFSSSRTHFLQHLLLTPPRALLCPLPPAAVLAGAVHVRAMLAMPVLPPWHRGFGEPSLRVWLAGLNHGAGLALSLKQRGRKGSWWCRCWKVPVWPGGLCCTASWHGGASHGAGLLGNVCAEGRGCPSCRLRPAPGWPPLDQSPSPPALAVGPGPPVRGQTLVPQQRDAVPQAGLSREPAGHFSSSQPGSHGDFCSVVFYSEMIVALFFLLFFFFNIYISKGWRRFVLNCCIRSFGRKGWEGNPAQLGWGRQHRPPALGPPCLPGVTQSFLPCRGGCSRGSLHRPGGAGLRGAP